MLMKTLVAALLFSPLLAAASTYNYRVASPGVKSGAVSPPPSAVLALSVAAVDFGASHVGQSVARSVTLSNTGNGPAAIGTPTTSTPFATSGDCPATLLAGASCSITTVFTPIAQGPASGSLAVTTSAGNLSASLVGEGLQLNFSVSPTTTIAFGTVLIGQTPVSAPVTLTNSGTEAIASVSIAPPSGYSVTANGCTTALAVNASCSFQVRFAPSVAAGYLGELTVTAGSVTRSIDVSGIGAAPPASSWTARASSFGTSNITNIAFGNGVFAAVGGGGKIATSADGISWTQRTTNTTADLRGITFGNGLFVASGGGGTLLTSTNGVSWAMKKIFTTSDYIWTIAFGNGVFVAGTNSNRLATSTDGVTWTQRTSPIGNIAHTAIAYGSGVFVATDYVGPTATSADGVTWTARTSPLGGNTFGLTYGNGQFVVVGAGGKIATSTNGTTWTTRASGATTQLEAVAYGNGTYFASGQSGVFLTSPDAVTWTRQTLNLGSSAIWGLAYGNNIYVAAGAGGALATSP